MALGLPIGPGWLIWFKRFIGFESTICIAETEAFAMSATTEGLTIGAIEGESFTAGAAATETLTMGSVKAEAFTVQAAQAEGLTMGSVKGDAYGSV